MRQFILIAVGFLAVTACRKKIDLEAYWNCNKSQNLDSVSVSSKIVGSWAWKKRSCFGSAQATKADKDITLIFHTGGTYLIQENGRSISQGTWEVKKGDGTSWKVETSAFNEYMLGRILFCEDELLFNHSYIDGCDNLFKKQ